MSENRVNPYNIQGARVYGNGKSYSLTNKVTAIDLCATLNDQEKTIKQNCR